MKIDKSNPSHWCYLVLFGLNVAIALLARPFCRRGAKRRVILYGHKLNGNLLAIYRHLQLPAQDDMETTFLTMDPAYHRELSVQNISCLLATSLRCISWVATADAVISDHGLHAMQLMLGRSSLKFFDVWHGIPFKGFDADDFRVQHRYDEIWVASPLMAQMYVERFGFDPNKVKVTGYARTDQLVRRDVDVAAIKRRFGLDGDDVGKVVLFAPTWKQDTQRRSIFPFGMAEDEFFQMLSQLAQRTGSTFVMRAHLNSAAGAEQRWGRVVQRPHALYPDTEALLLISDILVCDWSSIAFDWMLLNRPTIFLDVAPPFAKGFSLEDDYRYGAVVGSADTLVKHLTRYLDAPDAYQQAYATEQAEVRERVYGKYADGQSAVKCVARLRAIA